MSEKTDKCLMKKLTLILISFLCQSYAFSWQSQVEGCLKMIDLNFKSCLAAYSPGDQFDKDSQGNNVFTGVTRWANSCASLHYSKVQRGRIGEALGCCPAGQTQSCKSFVEDYVQYDPSQGTDFLINKSLIKRAVAQVEICSKVTSDNTEYCRADEVRSEVRRDTRITERRTQPTRDFVRVEPETSVDDTPRHEVSKPIYLVPPPVRHEQQDGINCNNPRTTTELNICQLQKLRSGQSR